MVVGGAGGKPSSIAPGMGRGLCCCSCFRADTARPIVILSFTRTSSIGFRFFLPDPPCRPCGVWGIVHRQHFNLWYLAQQPHLQHRHVMRKRQPRQNSAAA